MVEADPEMWQEAAEVRTRLPGAIYPMRIQDLMIHVEGMPPSRVEGSETPVGLGRRFAVRTVLPCGVKRNFEGPRVFSRGGRCWRLRGRAVEGFGGLEEGGSARSPGAVYLRGARFDPNREAS